ncbi:DNA-directed RNA polymerase III subunit RPC4-like isoform X1 [Asterias amurensis]|uniref:DNA-directed RNA polymerase III subunit RPC4-like isoform X1 n=1 Tax=Asterias amurensis TaxID=7602 RepID=UPI003AB81932
MSGQEQSPSSGNTSGSLPRGLIGRRGGIVNPSTRLPSLRPARDLTLGGVQKKAFKPNLTSAGRKERSQKDGTSKESVSSDTPRQRGQKSGRGDGGRGRGRGRGRPETIQSHSIFEQGPADRLNKKVGGGSGYLGGGGDSKSSSSSRPIKRDKMTEEDSRRMKEILRDDFVSELDGDYAENQYCPIHLPLVAALSLKKEHKQDAEIKMECEEEKKEIKKEPDAGEDVEMPEPETKPSLEKIAIQPKTSTKSIPERTTCASIFGSRTKSEGELIFFQFPDTLPGQAMTKDDEEQRPKFKQEPGTTTADTDSHKKSKEDNKPVKCTLQSLPEGYLGKMQVLKSGKTRLVLGNVTLDVATGTQCGFLQDVMSLRLDDDERSGEMIRLGHVKNRIVCTPNFESLLQLST